MPWTALYCSEMGTIDLNDVGVFVTVVEAASFSRAASRLGLPKSSVSRAVTRLEEAMGARVLHRTTRQVSLSTAGTALYERVRAQVTSLRHAVGDLPELQEEPSGRLRVTAVADIGEWLVDVVARFVKRYSAVEVDLHLTNEYVDLVAARIDVALRFSTKRLASSSLTARKLAASSLQLFAAPSYLAVHGTPRTPRDLESHEWVIYDRAQRFRLVGPEAAVTVVPRGRIISDSMTFQCAALVRGCGLGALSPDLGDPETARGNLVRVLPKWSSPISSLWALWPGSRRVPRKVSAFLELVADSVKSWPRHPA